METNMLVIPGLSDEDIGTLLNVRSYDYYVSMRESIQNNTCQFCKIDHVINKVLYENASWMIFHSAFPQKHQDLHLVIPHKKHLLHIKQLDAQDWIDFDEICVWANNHFDLPGGAIVMRFGDPRRNASSLRHLHGNIQIPNGRGRVQAVFAKSPEDIAKKHLVLQVFEKMFLGTPFNKLSAEDQELVKDKLK